MLTGREWEEIDEKIQIAALRVEPLPTRRAE